MSEPIIRRRARLVTLLAATGLAAVAACGRGGADVVPSASASSQWPAGRTFLSTAVTESGRDHPLVAGTRISLRFQDRPEIVADAGCNTLSVGGSVDGARFIAERFAATAMGCDEPRSSQDRWIVDFFTAGPSFRVAGDTLVLTAGEREIRLVDERSVNPDRPLIGTRWVVDGTFSADTAASAPADTASLAFGADGSVTGTTGCATISGAADVTGQIVAIGILHRVERACAGAVRDLDVAVTRALRGSVTARIEGDRLTLTTVDGYGLMLRAAG